VLVTYEGYNSKLFIQTLSDGDSPVYRLEHNDTINAPCAMFCEIDGKIVMLLNFQGLCISAEEWPAVKQAADEMLLLWREYQAEEGL